MFFYIFYSRLLNLCNSDEALREGFFYGLQYANPYNEMYDSNHIFSYLRGTDKELLLIATNFSDSDKECEISIPEEALAFYGITGKEKKQKATELLTGKAFELMLTSNEKLRINIPANNGVILKFNI